MNETRKAELAVACELTELADECFKAAVHSPGFRPLAEALQDIARQMRALTLNELLDWQQWRREQEALTGQGGTLLP